MRGLAFLFFAFSSMFRSNSRFLDGVLWGVEALVQRDPVWGLQLLSSTNLVVVGCVDQVRLDRNAEAMLQA